MPVATIDRIQMELPELPLHGPFGGVQSEVPEDLIEQLGFSDLLNILLRNGAASVRPGYSSLPGGARINGVADFFDNLGARHQAKITATGLFEWSASGQSWTQITGALTGGATDLFTWAVVNNKLLFSQGIDVVKAWDGIGASFATVDANAVAARFLMELNTHLLVGYTVESGTAFTNRWRWTGAGDPTDWISFNSGVVDILGDLGPVSGGGKILSQGYSFHNAGMTQIIPTGIGVAPFSFRPFGSKGKGNVFPYSLAFYAEQLAAYVGREDVFIFDGSESVPIGSKPIAGNLRVGARSRIFTDLAYSKPLQVYGYISSSIAGANFKAYWLVIPGVSTWIYNFDEENWTRWSFDKTPNIVGTFYNAIGIRIKDLVGTIAQQNWTPATLNSPKPFDNVVIGFTDGTPGMVDFTGVSETQWLIKSGQLSMGDRRHNKDIQRFRLVFKDIAPTTFTVNFINEKGVSQSHILTLGTGSGKILSEVVPFHISGLFLTWTITGAPHMAASFIEFSPIYAIGGEYKNL